MKYQALRPHFFSVVGGWRVLGVDGGVVADEVGQWVGGCILLGWVGCWCCGEWVGG